MRMTILLMMIGMLGAGCAANCKNVQQELEKSQQIVKDQDLVIKTNESTIRQKDEQLKQQDASMKKMELQIIELNRKLTISSSEKGLYDNRIKNISYLVREYLKNQISQNRDFLIDTELKDFIGNELIQREYSGDSGIFIVDEPNPVPNDGEIDGIGGYFLEPADIVVKLLRPVEKGYIVTYSKQLKVDIDKPGKKYVDFDNALIVKKGDIVAFYFPNTVAVPYDSGLGSSAYLKLGEDKYENGEKIVLDDIGSTDQLQRKYSLNYFGIFIQK